MTDAPPEEEILAEESYAIACRLAAKALAQQALDRGADNARPDADGWLTAGINCIKLARTLEEKARKKKAQRT